MLEDLQTVLTSSEYMGYFWQGFWHTILISFIAVAIGLVLGFIVAVVKIAAMHNKWMKIPAFICNVYTTIIRGTPTAVQLFLMVFVIIAITSIRPAVIILTFGINSGAYVSESIRAGIMSVDKGQMEAGRSLGMSWSSTMVRIVFPQAIKNVVPAIGNEMIALLKETSIINLVGATVGQLTFDINAAASEIITKVGYLAPTIIAACLYLIIVYAMVLIVKLVEGRLRKSDRR